MSEVLNHIPSGSISPFSELPMTLTDSYSFNIVHKRPEQSQRERKQKGTGKPHTHLFSQEVKVGSGLRDGIHLYNMHLTVYINNM